jgi:hypothetical protein
MSTAALQALAYQRCRLPRGQHWDSRPALTYITQALYRSTWLQSHQHQQQAPGMDLETYGLKFTKTGLPLDRQH